jgi:Cu-Zn family superoxide dismutase
VGIRVIAEVSGLTPGDHGFHVHQWGDASAPDGTSAGGHFNPHDTDHALPEADVRHVGDLGNLHAGADGRAVYDRIDTGLSLGGAHTIIGRGLIIHAKTDDGGQPTGNAGARVAIGVIGIAKNGTAD